MAFRLLWDNMETAILIDYYIQIKNGNLTRAKAIADASRELRGRAVRNGIEIDDAFRNENGIAMQLTKIEDLFLERRGRLSKAPQVFIDTVHQYLTDRKSFDKVLRKARGVNDDSISVEKQFFNWLSEKVPSTDTHNLYLAYKDIELFCRSRKILKESLFKTVDIPTIVTVKNRIDSKEIFRFAYKKKAEQMQFAINYYFEFVKAYESDKDFGGTNVFESGLRNAEDKGIVVSRKPAQLAEQQQNITPYRTEEVVASISEMDEGLASYGQILSNKFQKGLRIESNLDLKRFIAYHNEAFGTALDADDEIVRKRVKEYILCVGIRHEDYVFAVGALISAETKEHLLDYVERIFAQGNKVLYYRVIFDEFNEEFLGQRIYDEDMLRTYLIYECRDKYIFERNYMSLERNVRINPKDEIKQALVSQGIPMKCAEISNSLPCFSENMIVGTLRANKEFISNTWEEYFHVSLIDLSDDELEDISGVIRQMIDERHFVSGNEMINAIYAKYPTMLERFQQFSQIGIRDAIAYYLGNRFSFRGNIISSLQKPLSMSDVFAEFAKTHPQFTLDELNVLKNEMNSTIYFDAVYENSLRVSRDRFVSKEEACFDVAKTDEAIASYCIGAYLPLSGISGFGVFPYAGFPWNIYLLEHYVASYSKKFKLLHTGYNADICVGAIVKKDSGIDDFATLITDALAHSGIDLNKEDAMQYLCDMGYLAKRRLSDIDRILIRAKAQKG